MSCVERPARLPAFLMLLLCARKRGPSRVFFASLSSASLLRPASEAFKEEAGVCVSALFLFLFR